MEILCVATLQPPWLGYSAACAHTHIQIKTRSEETFDN